MPAHRRNIDISNAEFRSGFALENFIQSAFDIVGWCFAFDSRKRSGHFIYGHSRRAFQRLDEMKIQYILGDDLMILELPSDLARAVERVAAEKGESVSDWILKLVQENIADDPEPADEDKADEFFGAEEIRRLDEMMKKWRKCRDSGEEMDSADQGNLTALLIWSLKHRVSELWPVPPNESLVSASGEASR